MADDAAKEFMARREAERKQRLKANHMAKMRAGRDEQTVEQRSVAAFKAAATRRANLEGKK